MPDLNTEPTKRATVTFKEGAVNPYFHKLLQGAVNQRLIMLVELHRLSVKKVQKLTAVSFLKVWYLKGIAPELYILVSFERVVP